MDLQTILTTVCTTTNTSVNLVRSQSRRDRIVTARFLFIYLSHQHTNCTAYQITRLIKRDHKLYYHAIMKVNEWRKYNKSIAGWLETINNQINLMKQ